MWTWAQLGPALAEVGPAALCGGGNDGGAGGKSTSSPPPGFRGFCALNGVAPPEDIALHRYLNPGTMEAKLPFWAFYGPSSLVPDGPAGSIDALWRALVRYNTTSAFYTARWPWQAPPTLWLDREERDRGEGLFDWEWQHV